MNEQRPLYLIAVAARLAGMHPQTLRGYEARGLIRPSRSAGNTRLYSDRDIARLRRIAQLTAELGLNLAGVEHVLRLEDEKAALEAEVCRLREALAQQTTVVTATVVSRELVVIPRHLPARRR